MRQGSGSRPARAAAGRCLPLPDAFAPDFLGVLGLAAVVGLAGMGWLLDVRQPRRAAAGGHRGLAARSLRRITEPRGRLPQETTLGCPSSRCSGTPAAA